MGFHKQHTNIANIQAIKQNTTSTLEFPLKTLSSCYPCPQKASTMVISMIVYFA